MKIKPLDIQKNIKTARVALAIEEQDIKLLKSLAKKNKVSLSEIIRAIIRSYFSQEKVEDKIKTKE